LQCHACGDAQVATGEALLERARSAGFLRRDTEFDLPFLIEILRTAAHRWQCERCAQTGLHVEQQSLEAEWDDRHCERCGRTIPPERIEVLPTATRCVTCETLPVDEWDDPSQFCPRCGSRMETRTSKRSGITRYVSTCPDCSRRGR